VAPNSNSITPAPECILLAARRPYLDFLRNLTPQALLAGYLIFEYTQITFSRVDLSNFGQTAAFYTVLAALLYSVFANCSIFIKEAFPSLTLAIRTSFRNSRSAGMSRLQSTITALKQVHHNHHNEFGILLFTGAFMVFTVVVVLIVAFASATAILRAFGH
jgi:hypothetical protein